MDGTPLSLPTHYPKRKIHFRNLKNINPDALTLDLKQLSASTADSHSVTEAVDTYNHSLRSLMDPHAPLKSCTVSFSHSAPWYTCELRTMKAAGRALKRRLMGSGLTVHKKAYREHQKAYREHQNGLFGNIFFGTFCRVEGSCS